MRPEQLALGSEGVSGRVGAVTYYGHDAVVQVELDGGALVSVRIAAPVAVAAGDTVCLTVKGAAHFYPSG